MDAVLEQRIRDRIAVDKTRSEPPPEAVPVPLIPTGRYVDRMSDHCGECRFDPKQRTGEDACPYSTLYWDFLARHEQRFARNPRIVQQVRAAQRLSDLPAVRERAVEVLRRLDAGTL